MYSNLPLELKLANRWCFSGRSQEPDMRLCKAPHMLVAGNMRPIAVTDEYHYCVTLEEIEELIPHYPDRDIGFILVNGDGFTCIDLDIKDDTPVEQTHSHAQLVEAMGTYTEMSQSGFGYHMWLKGEIEGVIKTKQMEVYSRERFIICTGKALLDLPMAYDREALDFFNDHANATVDYECADDSLATMTNEQLMAAILEGDHTGKFAALYNGNWDTYIDILSDQREDYMEFNPSDADAAFMTIVTFYSQNFEQCKTIWRQSALADVHKRYQGDASQISRKAKNTGTPYKLNRIITLGIQRNSADAAILKAQAAAGQEAADALRKAADEAKLDESHKPAVFGVMQYPPGMMGELAKYYEAKSIKPIREFAIAEAIATAAGLFGRSYNISGTGLNTYLMILAESGSGKSALSKNPEALFTMLERDKGIIGAKQFVNTKRFTHENAMYKEFKERSCFVQCLSEFGKQFRNMVSVENQAGALATVREQMTDIYSKSGRYDSVGGLRYSTDEKSIDLPYAVAYSFLGESVAEPFFEAITPDMFTDGFMSRFLIMEYTGAIPYDNMNADVAEIPPALLAHMEAATLGVTRSLIDVAAVNVMPVGRSPEAGKWFSDFSKHCTDMTNSLKGSPVKASMWTRFNLKLMKLSALLAVMDKPSQPVIETVHIEWAYDFINRNNDLIGRAITGGRVGSGNESERVESLKRLCKGFITSEPIQGRKYGIDNVGTMQVAGVLPWSYLTRRTSQLGLFSKHKYRTASQLTRDALNELISSGTMSKVPRDEAVSKYNFSGECYRFIGD